MGARHGTCRCELVRAAIASLIGRSAGERPGLLASLLGQPWSDHFGGWNAKIHTQRRGWNHFVVTMQTGWVIAPSIVIPTRVMPQIFGQYCKSYDGAVFATTLIFAAVFATTLVFAGSMPLIRIEPRHSEEKALIIIYVFVLCRFYTSSYISSGFAKTNTTRGRNIRFRSKQ